MDIEQQDALIEELGESMKTDGVITMEGLKLLFDNKNKIMEEGTTTIEFYDFFADTILEWVGDELDEAKADILIQLMSDDIDDSKMHCWSIWLMPSFQRRLQSATSSKSTSLTKDTSNGQEFMVIGYG